MKIHITGNAGSGKTTLANELGQRLGLPIYGLDKIVWREGWELTPVEERRKLESDLVGNDEWIIEGVSSIARGASDITIFLDVPRYACIWRILKRSSQYLFTSRPELPDNCPELVILPEVLKITWNFPKLVNPVIKRDMNNSVDRVITTSRERSRLFEELKC